MQGCFSSSGNVITNKYSHETENLSVANQEREVCSLYSNDYQSFEQEPFNGLSAELCGKIFCAVIGHEAKWSTISRIAMVSKWMFKHVTQLEVIRYFFKQDSLGNLEIETSTALRFLKNYAAKAHNMRIKFIDSSEMTQAEAKLAATLCHYKSFVVEELDQMHFVQDKNIKQLLKNSTQLKLLYLSDGSQLTRISMKAISKYGKELRSLAIHNINSQAFHSLSLISTLSKLKKLTLSAPCNADMEKWPSAGILAIAENCLKLTELKLSYLPLSPAELHMIAAKCVHLKSLALQEVQLTDQTLLDFASLRGESIRNLELIHPGLISEKGLAALSKCENISSFTLLASHFNVSDSLLGQLVEAWPSLNALHLHNTAHLTTTSIEKLMKNCKKLEALGLYDFQVTSESLETILASGTNLNKLDFGLSSVYSKDLFPQQIGELFIKYSARLRNLCTVYLNSNALDFEPSQEKALSTHLPQLNLCSWL